MSLLLNPRVWIALALVAALAFSHFTAYRKGRDVVKTEWLAAVSAANAEARALEQARQRRADEAGRLAASREARLRADAARAGDAVRGLRNAISASNLRNESCAAANQRAATYGELLGESAEALRGMAAACDRHASDVKTLLDAWPQ